MLLKSQPLDPKFCEKFKLGDDESERKIKSQHIGKMFDDILDGKRKIGLKTRIGWIWRDIKGVFYDMKYAVRNRLKWRKSISGLRPWEGFDGLITVMQAHLRDYITTEEKYGHSLEEYKNKKIATAKETVEILERMREPIDYSIKRRDEVESRYPKYQSLITKYESGSTLCSGDFVVQDNGWVGMESGKDPRRGYFEFVNGCFELAESPDQTETDRLLAELMQYHEEIDNAYGQADIDSDNDFERLGELLKENFYTWWD
ncbi:MAG: hypothetical protein FWD23_03155 [Oscillospiraceae bacterium]|nr:hypothetical protein [Oscillospiraceae bacterium]